jgi:L-lysine exporter family protein LysE/ArgO
MISRFIEGFATGAGLIVAIGVQNAFVLKQGLLRRHLLVVALFCALSDAVLIALGVGGFGTLLAQNEILILVAKWGGAAFLFWCGFKSFRAVFKNEAMKIEMDGQSISVKATLISLAMFTFLNPHVYLDTCVLLGTISSQFTNEGRLFFGLGAVASSFVWFFSLTFGAQLLLPLFQKPISWKILDFLIGCIMWTIAVLLLVSCMACD